VSHLPSAAPRTAYKSTQAPRLARSTSVLASAIGNPRLTSPSLQFTKSLSLDGHSDWVRCLSFTTPIPASSNSSISYDISPGEVLLASGSQDNYIRLWRFSRISHQPQPTTTLTSSTGLDALDELEQSLADGELRVKAHDFVVSGDGEFSCSSEAVLLGHDAWVTGLHWAPHLPSQPLQQLQLLSSSADRSMILWTPTSSDPSSSSSSSPAIWTSFRRFGEFSSATNLGFFGALWGKDGRTVLASGWGGSWHVWRKEDDEGEWEPVVATAGHFGEVKSLAWEPEGAFLLSAGCVG
jgi:elongator complex protein 2